MKRVPQILQLTIIIEWSRLFSLEPQLFQELDFLPGSIAARRRHDPSPRTGAEKTTWSRPDRADSQPSVIVLTLSEVNPAFRKTPFRLHQGHSLLRRPDSSA